MSDEITGREAEPVFCVLILKQVNISLVFPPSSDYLYRLTVGIIYFPNKFC